MFSLIDIAMFGDVSPALQIGFSVLSYGFIIAVGCSKIKSAIMYLISFNLLTIGWGNYAEFDNISFGYWGIRIGRFSVNILIQLIFCIILIIKRWNSKKILCKDKFSKFFLVYVIWTSIIGAIYMSLDYIYPDNYINDFLTYIPLIFYIILFKGLSKEDLIKIFRYCFSISLISLLWAYLLDKKMSYSVDNYLVYNSLYYILPVGVFILRKYFKLWQLAIFVAVMAFLFYQNEYFISGKTIIIIIIMIIWLLCQHKGILLTTVLSLAFIIPYIISISNHAVVDSSDSTLNFKINQVLALFSTGSLKLLASTDSSIGNLIAEGMTLVVYLIQNPIFLITGKGCGAGIPDLFGYLSPFCYLSGYKKLDGLRNDFVGLHLAFYMVLLRGGILLFIYYLKMLWRLIKENTSISFLGLLMLMLVFYASKDYMLLTYLLLRISVLSEKQNTGKKNGKRKLFYNK